MGLLTKQDVASILQCKEKTVAYYVSTKQIPFLMIGKEVRFKPDSIQDWLRQRENKVALSKGV